MAESRPKVSVNLCCYNSEPFLRETLASLFAQTFTDYELIAVNDGSTDATGDILRSAAAEGKPVVIHEQKNAGLGAARNKALELSRGELIAILDHDDVWDPRKLEKQTALFRRPEVSFAGCDARWVSASGKPLGRYSDANALHRGAILKELFLRNFIPCAAVVVRRSAVEKAGGFFRPDFRIAEEYELFLRLAEFGEFDFAPEALVDIRVHPGSAGWDTERERAEMRMIYEECLRRNPGLAESLGPRAVAVKRTGLWLRPGQAAALNGRAASLRDRISAAALYGLSRLGPRGVARILSLKRKLSRLKASL